MREFPCGAAPLRALLPTWRDSARTRISEAAQASRSGVVVFGSGVLGRRLLLTLRSNGCEPACLSDNNANLWGRTIDAVPVVEPAEAVDRFGASHTFIVAVWRPAALSAIASVTEQLRRLGCRSVMSFVPFLRIFHSLPHYLWDGIDAMDGSDREIGSALNLMADDQSRLEFLGHLQFRLTAEPSCLTELSPGAQYFPPFLRPRDNEVFVDCGAYDGDSIRDFVEWTAGQFRGIVAFEPDPVCRASLLSYVEKADIGSRCRVRPEVVSSRAGTIRFAATGEASAAICADGGGMELPAITLDEAELPDPTFIKMDIEGAECEALLGARRTIERVRPLVAVCVYHRQSDLWRIPLLLNDIYPQARLFLRSHRADGFDCVCYAVPRA